MMIATNISIKFVSICVVIDDTQDKTLIWFDT